MVTKIKPQKRIKVLFIDHLPFVGGAQICLARDLEYINRKTFLPYLAIDKDSKFDFVFKKSKVKIFKIRFGKLKKIDPTSLTELLNSAKDLVKLIDQIKPDIVVTNTTRALILAAVIKGFRGGKNLLPKTTHQKNFKLLSRVWDYDYPKWLFNGLKIYVDKFSFVSESIRAYYGEKKPKAEVIYLGSDLGKKYKVQSTKYKNKVDLWREHLGIEKGDFIIGFAGRLVEWKGPLFLFNSFKKTNNPKLKLIYFGAGKGQIGDVEERLRKEIRKANLEDRVKLAGFIEDQVVIYNLINCFVLASIKPEPFATNVIEAALAKKPIVATYIGGTPEFIKSGRNGLLVKPNDTKQLASNLDRISLDKALAKKLSANAFKDAQKYKEEKFIVKLENILLQLS